MYDDYNCMITFDPNESTTRILSEFILSDASRVFLHIIGRYDNETFEAYFDYDSDCKVLSYQILSSDEQVAKLTNLFYTISDSNMYNILQFKYWTVYRYYKGF